MRFGPTTLKTSVSMARGLRRPKLRTDLQISEQVVAGETSFVIKIPELFTFARYGPLEYSLLRLADGTRTHAEIAGAINQEHGEGSVTEEDVAEFIESINPNFLERGAAERNLAILEKIREERRERVNTSSLLYIHFSAWNPDETLERILPYLRWMYTRGFVIFSLFLFFVMGVILASDWTRIQRDTIAFYTFSNKSAYDLWIFWVLLFLVIGVHEFGHGLTCKNFGGEVPQMGFMLIYFGPAFFTDTTDMHVFDKTSKRQWTIFAGLWIEMVICALATLVWYFAPPGSFTGDLGYKLLLLTGVSGLVFNLNPLMKYDGYYALGQYLEVDNLREDSFEYLKLWVERYVLRQEVELPAVSKRKRRIFLTYGICASLYSALIIYVFGSFMKNVFVRWYGDWGYVATAAALYFMLRKRVNKVTAAIRIGWPHAKEKFMAWKMTRGQTVAVAAAGLLLVLPPTATKIGSEFVLEPGARAEVRAIAPGVLQQEGVHEGARVEAGAVLGVLHNAQLEARAASLTEEKALAERGLLAASGAGDMTAAQKFSAEYERVKVELAEALRKRDALVLRAPIAGVVTTPGVERRAGEYLAEGELFVILADRSTARARVLVRDWELQDVAEHATVKMNVRAYPYRTFSGRVRAMLPAAAAEEPVTAEKMPERAGRPLSNYFAVVLEFSNTDGALTEGMTGTAKIYGVRRPLAWQWARGGWRWIKSLIW
ncbi:MAG: HlyD family efflux transporter periplasmic adaptor subunit [Acidipila sp.]|nr:HlyD family efflux transporter periplasmic adaptor subunit [Acidipila sp.]